MLPSRCATVDALPDLGPLLPLWRRGGQGWRRAWPGSCGTHRRPAVGTDASPEGTWRLFLTGMAINFGNPKVTVFFLALLPTVVDLRVLTLADFLVLGLTVAVCATAVLWAYALAAARARRDFTSPRAVRLMHRGSSVAMAGAAAAVAAR
jgi:threonine/homoserine/homoserine lactone efflux protein